MAKISKFGGPSDVNQEMTDYDPVRINRPNIEGNGGAPSVGSNSEQSDVNESKSSNSETPSPQVDAPTTENPSSQTEKADSTVPSTDGDTPKTQARRSGKRKARTGSTDEITDEDDWDE
jgi:hypothetical protein